MNSQRLLCSKKAGVNVRIKAFWYTKIFSTFLFLTVFYVHIDNKAV